jgi:pantothenate synthetase
LNVSDRNTWRQQADLQAPSGGDEVLMVLGAARLGQPRLIDNVDI